MLSRTDRSCTAFEALEGRALLDAHLVATLGALSEGRDGRVTVVATIRNTGDAFYRGGDSIFFFLSHEVGGQNSYQLNGSGVDSYLGTPTLSQISAHGKATIKFNFDPPSLHLADPLIGPGYAGNHPVVSGEYLVNTDLNLGVRTDVTTGLRAVSTTELAVDGRFGNLRSGDKTLSVGMGVTSVPEQYRLSSELFYYYTRSLSDVIGTLKIDGPGWGDITLDHTLGSFVVTLHGTTSRTILTLGAPRNAQSFFTHLIIAGSLGTLRLDRSTLGGSVTINGSVRTLDLTGMPASSQQQAYSTITQPALNLTVNGAVNELRAKTLAEAAIHLNGSSTTRIAASNLIDTSIDSQGGITSLEARSWTDGYLGSSLHADWVGKLSIGGDMIASMTLTGDGAPGGATLKEASIKGTAGGGSVGWGWNIVGNVGSVSVGGFMRNLNIAGDLSKLRVEHDISYVTIAARNIGSLDFRANADLFILAGAYLGRSPAGSDPGAPRTFGVGTIGSISVRGNLWGLVAAGADPQDPSTFDGWFHGDLRGLLTGGRIGKITVSGRAEAVSTRALFAAASLPTTASIRGRTVPTAGDPRFRSTV